MGLMYPTGKWGEEASVDVGPTPMGMATPAVDIASGLLPWLSKVGMTAPESMTQRDSVEGGPSPMLGPVVGALGLMGGVGMAKMRKAPSVEVPQEKGLLDFPMYTEVRDTFRGGLNKESTDLVNRFARERGQSSVHYNSKTGLSLDWSTSCPNKLNPLKGPCPYCYVEHGREVDKLFNMKGGAKAASENPYRGEVAEFPDDLVKNLNKDGGMRMFSFGDYRPDVDFESTTAMLADAQKKGLMIKAITKEPQFVKDFADHPNLRINISTDNVPRDISANAPTIQEAMKLKGKRDNVKIRAVALNPEEAEMFAKDKRIDVVTLYHGLTNFDPKGNRHDKLLQIVMDQNPQIVERMGVERLRDYLDTWKNMSPKSKVHEDMAERYPSKICCQGGKCARDKTKCGFGNFGALLLGGVFLPAAAGEDE